MHWIDGVTISLTSSTPCWLGVCWGAKIADVYPVIHAAWQVLCNRTALRAILEDISLCLEDLEMYLLFMSIFSKDSSTF